MKNPEDKITFLTNAISETQELIRFTETKTAIAIALLSAYSLGAFSVLDKIIKYHYKLDCLFWILLVIFIIALSLSIIVITRIILHTTSPVKNIKGFSKTSSDLKYFHSPNENKDIFYPFMNRSRYKLATNYSMYLKSIKESTSNEIIDTLTLELLKVSYIRNLKSDRFKKLLVLLLFTSIAFAMLYFVYIWESQKCFPIEKIAADHNLKL